MTHRSVIATASLIFGIALFLTFAAALLQYPAILIILYALITTTLGLVIATLILTRRESYASKLERDMREQHGVKLERPVQVAREIAMPRLTTYARKLRSVH